MADEVAGKAYIELEAKLDNLEANIISQIRSVGGKSGSTFASSFQSALSPLKGYIASAISVGVVAEVGKEVFNLASQVQQAKVAFDKLTGSEEVSLKLLNDIKQFAKTTPFDQMGLVDGAKRLLAYGFTANNVIPIMNSLGNAVSAVGGNQETLNGVIVALGQMQTKGRLVQQEVNQIAERGIPIFDILKEKLGLTNEQLGDIGNQGISAAKAIPLILEGINERFAGIMEEQAQTLQGKYSNMMDVVKITMADIGLSTADGMGDAISSITEFLNDNHDQIVQYASDALDVVGDTISVMVDAIQGVGDVIGDVANTGAGVIKDMNSDVLENTDATMSGIKGDWTDLLYYLKLGITAILGSINVAINVSTSAIRGWFSFIQNGGESVVKVIVGTITGSISTLTSFYEYIGSWYAKYLEFMGNLIINRMNSVIKTVNAILPDDINISTISNIKYTESKISTPNRDLLKQGTSQFGEVWNKSFSGVSDAWNTTTDKMVKNLENDYVKRVKSINDKEAKDFINLQKEKIQADIDVYEQKIKSGQKLTKAEEEDYNKRKEFLGSLNKQFDDSTGRIENNMDDQTKKSKKSSSDIVENYKDINSAVEKSSKTIEGYQEDIEKVGDKFEDLKKTALKNISDINLEMQELGGKTDEKLGNRFAELTGKIKELKSDMKASGLDEYTASVFDLSTLNSIKETGAKSVDGFDIDKFIELKKAEAELKDVTSSTTKEVRDQALAYSELSETQKILYDKQKELLVLQEKKAISEAFANQQSLDGTALQIKQTGDAIQAFYQDEQGNLVEIKNIKNIQYAQDLIDKQTSLQQEIQLITDKKTVEEGLYKLLSQNKILYEQTYTSALRTEISKQKSLVDELISKYYELNAVKGASVSSDGVSGKRAYGGNVKAGEIYLTGENHHNEKFTPYTSGFISPSYDNSKHISVDIGQISSNNPQDFGDRLRSNIGNYL